MLDILLFAAFAVYMGVKLYNALGRKDFEETKTQKAENKAVVVPFPGGIQTGEVKDVAFTEVRDEDDYDALEARLGADVVGKIKEIRTVDPGFTEKNFIKGARYAFEMILGAFAKGDKEKLKPLLSKDIYKGFADAIDAREKNDQIEENTLVAVLASNIKDIVLKRKIARVAVEIVSEQINLIKDRKGKVIEGDPSEVNKLSEIWTFERNLASSNPNWELVATGQA